MASTKPMHIYVGVGVSGQLPSRKIAPRLGLGFGLGLALKLGLRGQFPSGANYYRIFNNLLREKTAIQV